MSYRSRQSFYLHLPVYIPLQWVFLYVQIYAMQLHVIAMTQNHISTWIICISISQTRGLFNFHRGSRRPLFIFFCWCFLFSFHVLQYWKNTIMMHVVVSFLCFVYHVYLCTKPYLHTLDNIGSYVNKSELFSPFCNCVLYFCKPWSRLFNFLKIFVFLKTKEDFFPSSSSPFFSH